MRAGLLALLIAPFAFSQAAMGASCSFNTSTHLLSLDNSDAGGPPTLGLLTVSNGNLTVFDSAFTTPVSCSGVAAPPLSETPGVTINITDTQIGKADNLLVGAATQIANAGVPITVNLGDATNDQIGFDNYIDGGANMVFGAYAGGTAADLNPGVAPGRDVTLANTESVYARNISSGPGYMSALGNADPTYGGSGAFTGVYPNGISFDGGDGADSLMGGPGYDLLRGGAGNDTINGGPGNVLDYMDGEAGTDTVTYAGRTDPIAATLDGTVNDGAAGEFDTLTGIENVTGGSGNDALAGDAGPNTLDGALGNDLLLGNGGNDMLLGGSGNDTGLGGDGNDSLLGADGNDALNGEGGNDSVSGESGNDTLTGGLGKDVLLGATGNDFLLAKDKARDAVINCGAGNKDKAKVDRKRKKRDPKAKGCEKA